MTKRQQERQLSDLGSTIQQILKGNEVVIARYKSWGVTLEELVIEYGNISTIYEKRWGYLQRKKNQNLINIAKKDMEQRVDNMSDEQVMELSSLIGIQ